MIKAIIIENCTKSLDYLMSLLQYYPEIHVTETASTVNEAFNLITQNSPDILFLDIELDDGDAFELLEKLPNKNFEVIFTTAYNNYYPEAFKHFAFNYLLKPIDNIELTNVITQYKKNNSNFNSNNLINFKKFIKTDDSKILLNTGYKHILISLNDIVYCKANQNFTIFKFISGDTKVISNSLKYYSGLFSEKGFFKANRSFLINISHIKQIIKRESIVMVNNEAINVSVKNRQNLKIMIDNLS